MGEAYQRVPKGVRENLEYRGAVLSRCRGDREVSSEFAAICKHDVLFWINTFGWIYEPRLLGEGQGQEHDLPFVTDSQQDGFFGFMGEVFGRQDGLVPKTREQGATWCVVYQFVHRLLFWPGESFMMMSSKEEMVDKPGDPDALFQKIDYILAHLPSWMVPPMQRTSGHIHNVRSRTSIDGESTNRRPKLGGRKTACLLDEFDSMDDQGAVLASTRGVTRNRLIVSAHYGPGTLFHKMRTELDVRTGGLKWRQFFMHWSNNTRQNSGMYTSEGGVLKVLNPPLPDGYEPVLDGKVRSPWYDAECSRCSSDREIASQLDGNPDASGNNYFEGSRVSKIRDRDVRPCLVRGDIVEGRFEASDGGPLRLWVNLTSDGRLPGGEKAIGCDVSSGSNHPDRRGASASVLCIVDCRTGEQVGELASEGLMPYRFARLAATVARWCGDRYQADDCARLCWEMQGPGAEFGKELIELGLRKFFFHKEREERNRLDASRTQVPGFSVNEGSKKWAYGIFRAALFDGHFTLRSRECVDELLNYQIDDRGMPVHPHIRYARTTGQRETHGDRVSAAVMAWLCVRYSGFDPDKRMEVEEPAVPSLRSFAGRRQYHHDRMFAGSRTWESGDRRM